MSSQLEPAPADAIVRSELRLTAFIALKSMVMPSSMFAAPAKGVWPPLRIANFGKLECFLPCPDKVMTMSATSEALVGLIIQDGERRASWNQYESTEESYVALPGYDTLSGSAIDRAEQLTSLPCNAANVGDSPTKNVINNANSRRHTKDMIFEIGGLHDRKKGQKGPNRHLYRSPEVSYKRETRRMRLECGRARCGTSLVALITPGLTYVMHSRRMRKVAIDRKTHRSTNDF